MRALAVAHIEPAIRAAMRETRFPTIAALPDKLIGNEGKVEPRCTENGTQDHIEAVGNDRDAGTIAPAQIDKGGKAWVDREVPQKRSNFFRPGPKQGRILRRGFPRRYVTIQPRLIDVPPRGIGEAVKQLTGWLIGRDGSVEVDVHINAGPDAWPTYWILQYRPLLD